jgi:hypothetical protein
VASLSEIEKEFAYPHSPSGVVCSLVVPGLAAEIERLEICRPPWLLLSMSCLLDVGEGKPGRVAH